MITLKAHDLTWIKGTSDDPKDYCAHSHVEFRVNGTTFVKPEDGRWTVSATALYLLRTLSFDHTVKNSLAEGNFLFPCCAFSVWPIKDKFEVICMGCPNGVDIEVRHREGKVILSSPAGNETVTESEWTHTVLYFVSTVRSFYDMSSPKIKIEDEFDYKGWKAFWEEWEQRVANVNCPKE
jgi:hypothetical protein